MELFQNLLGAGLIAVGLIISATIISNGMKKAARDIKDGLNKCAWAIKGTPGWNEPLPWGATMNGKSFDERGNK